jgi:hypothetical protein
VSTERDNVRVWAPDQQGVYEVWYATWNHPGTGQGFWLRFITEAPTLGSGGVPTFGEAPRGELWFARFDPNRPERTFGIHKRFGDVASGADPFRIAIAGCELGHDHSFGELAGDGHDVRWDLRWEPAVRTLRFYPDVMYGGATGRAPTMAHSPNPRVPLSGTLLVDGEELTFDRAYAGQSHVWGKKHALAWAWGHCADFAGAPDALLEIIAAKIQRRGITSPNLVMVALDLDGEQHRLNQFRHVALNRGRWSTGRIELSARSLDVRVDVELTCAHEDLVNAPYVDPDGTEVFCANTAIGNARVTIYKRSGLRWREHRRLEVRRRAHFETGGRVRDPRAAWLHVLVT